MDLRSAYATEGIRRLWDLVDALPPESAVLRRIAVLQEERGSRRVVSNPAEIAGFFQQHVKKG